MNSKRESQTRNNTFKDISTLSKLSIVLCVYLLTLLFLSIMPEQAGGKMRKSKPNLPESVGLWKRPDSPQFVNAKNIFDYMDGAGELYLGYRFDHLESYEYESEEQKSILAELYFMKTSDDAFGLLSLDWGGEPVELDQSLQENAEAKNSSWPNALYGEGLLRLWSDTIYARIMAYEETVESKKAVLKLGRSIVKDRGNPPRPNLLRKLRDSFPPNWELCKDRTSYFRSHLVLNSIYYLGQENMLDLDLTSEAVTTLYERKYSSGSQVRIRFLFVKYLDIERARVALAHFHRAYLPEHPFQIKSGYSGRIVNMFPIEDGWLGYTIQNNTIAFIFECPDKVTTETIIEQIK